MKQFPLSVHYFRRDLRLVDNTALNAALKQSEEVQGIFCLDPRQVEEHPYRTAMGLRFLYESLCDLEEEIAKKGGSLLVVRGKAEECICELLTDLQAKALFFNRDYTPFSRIRDQALYKSGKEKGFETHQFADTLLNEPEVVLKKNGEPYTVYTPFAKRASAEILQKPSSLVEGVFGKRHYHRALTDWKSYLEPLLTSQSAIRGGRSHAYSLLEKIKIHGNYAESRNALGEEGTTKLSAHHKFGTLSVREVSAAVVSHFAGDHALIRELLWRDFYTHIAFHFPRVFREPFQEVYKGLEWHENESYYQRWCEGTTGFPLVDAGIRELLETGFMHNRARMIVASFLTKDLRISYREGERFFARHLVDYDPSVNNGSWQWAASTGCDAQPYFRIFNPWLQQKRFDPEGVYVKRWIPELRDVKSSNFYDPAAMHALSKSQSRSNRYPPPIVDHSTEKKITEEFFRSHLSSYRS
jgi:deoxyribodipyrimidine photo-lyase